MSGVAWAVRPLPGHRALLSAEEAGVMAFPAEWAGVLGALLTHDMRAFNMFGGWLLSISKSDKIIAPWNEE